MSNTFPVVSLHDVVQFDPDTTLILSVNNRHARRIVTELSASLGQARRVMAIPDIVPLAAWLIQAADHLSFHAEHDTPSHTVDNFGALYLWRRVISLAESDKGLLDVGQAARLACDADRLLDDWRISVQPTEETVDYQRFLTWRARYRAYLDEFDMEDNNQASERVCRAVSEGVLNLSVEHVVLAGFNEVSPRLQGLLAEMRTQGIAVSVLEQSSERAGDIQRVQVSDSYAEWRLAAQWACERLEQDAEGRYAIVAPRLEGNVALAHRILHQELGRHGFVFNIAVGRPLSEWPLVRAALAWLRVVVTYRQSQPCRAGVLGEALLSGACVAHIEEAPLRSSLDARLRQHGVVAWSESAFSEQLSARVPKLGEAWKICMETAATLTGQHTLFVWSQHLRVVLQTLGFPGNAPLDSHAYQALDAFDQLIERLSLQAPVAGKVSFGTAVGLLSQLAQETLFQPQRDPRSRLDVLGFLESEGGRWDGVWILGLTDDVLPAAPQPNPLIPLAALRRVNAPRATPERELEWAQSIYNALLACAPQVWLSHPAQEGERELRPSPCIASLPLSCSEPQQQLPSVLPLQYVVDEQGPPLSDGESVKGGIALIDTQARNPLWAFVKYRLGASELSDYALLTDQSVRGNFLHRAMELFWRMLPDQGSLNKLLSARKLDTMVGQVIEQAADECLLDFSPALRNLETERANAILARWLDLEVRREPFAVAAVEQRERWCHAGLELNIRLDRVDRLADGRLAVMDYKTGASIADPRHSWVRDRPVELQLPLYAAVLNRGESGVAALIQAYLHSRKTDTAGVSDGDCGLSGIAHFTSWEAFEGMSWEQVLTRWQEAIQNMALEFSRGYASNSITDLKDLIYCDVLPFLRLTEEYPSGDQTTQ